ncbi:hypothetical protein PIB30_085326, partial [Stylosanthes scabra]|nr:hypothetical protein [Stylosanthes scabra]
GGDPQEGSDGKEDVTAQKQEKKKTRLVTDEEIPIHAASTVGVPLLAILFPATGALRRRSFGKREPGEKEEERGGDLIRRQRQGWRSYKKAKAGVEISQEVLCDALGEEVEHGSRRRSP